MMMYDVDNENNNYVLVVKECSHDLCQNLTFKTVPIRHCRHLIL